MGATTSKIVENPIVITEITTNIFNNDFSQPLLDDGCVVVYKITKNYQIENREIKAAIEQEEQNNKRNLNRFNNKKFITFKTFLFY